MTNSPPSAPIPASSGVTVSAPAKVNLILRILDRRPDGYHNLRSIMHTVGLQDEVRIRLSPDTPGVRLRCNQAQLPLGRGNLVHEAAMAVLGRAQKNSGLEIELQKTIPMGAGLGGGSSDAAATIIGLNRLLQLGWSQAQMAEVGRPLGSDVPFFFFAPSADVSGTGEVVKPLQVDGTRWLVLLNPGFGVETKWAYQELAAARNHVPSLSPEQTALGLQSRVDWTQLQAAAENDFETPVFAKHGILRGLKQALLREGAELALLSGSGATVFGVFKDEEAARGAAAQFVGDQQLKTFVVRTCSGPLTVRETPFP